MIKGYPTTGYSLYVSLQRLKHFLEQHTGLKSLRTHSTQRHNQRPSFRSNQPAGMPTAVCTSTCDDISPFLNAANGFLLQGVHVPRDAVAVPSRPAKQKKQHNRSLKYNFRKLTCLYAPARSLEPPAESEATNAANPATSWQTAGGFPSATVHQSIDKAVPLKYQSNQPQVICPSNSGGRVHNRRTSLQSIELHPIPEALSYSSNTSESDWYDTYSMVSDDSPANQEQPLPQLGKWLPESTLLFAEPGLQFIPVPKVTGFAGYWEVDEGRTTPHPQPIDVMIGANMLVRRVHKSIAGMEIKETGGQLMIAGQPTFIPPGFPSVYCEIYDKTNRTLSSWTPRRDLKLGSCHGKVYMTDTGMLVLRVESRTAFTNRVEYIVEDYITLEEGGQVIVDRMCCYEVATGRRETQVQVARLRIDKV